VLLHTSYFFGTWGVEDQMLTDKAPKRGSMANDLLQATT